MFIFSYKYDVKLFTCAEARSHKHVGKQPFLQIKMLPRSMTNERLTGVVQIQGAHVVLISCLSRFKSRSSCNNEKFFSPEAVANNPLKPAFPLFFS